MLKKGRPGLLYVWTALSSSRCVLWKSGSQQRHGHVRGRGGKCVRHCVVPVRPRYQSWQSSQPQFISKPNCEAVLLMARLYQLFIMAECLGTDGASGPARSLLIKYTSATQAWLRNMLGRKCEVTTRMKWNSRNGWPLQGMTESRGVSVELLARLHFSRWKSEASAPKLLLPILIGISQTLLLS